VELENFFKTTAYCEDNLKNAWDKTISYLSNPMQHAIPEIKTDVYYEQLLKKETFL
jgi:hypothetical protein